MTQVTCNMFHKHRILFIDTFINAKVNAQIARIHFKFAFCVISMLSACVFTTDSEYRYLYWYFAYAEKKCILYMYRILDIHVFIRYDTGVHKAR